MIDQDDVDQEEIEKRWSDVDEDPPEVDAPEESIDVYQGVVIMRARIGDDELTPVDSWISARREEWRSTEPALED